jgi:hypothetical protein
MPKFLKDLRISEVSSVDAAANSGAKIILRKADDVAERALCESLASILADDAVVDKATCMAEQIKDYQHYVAQARSAKGVSKMSLHDEKIIAIAKNVVAGRCMDAVFEKSAYHKAIERRAEAIRRPGETAEGAYTRALMDDPDAKLLKRAMRSAKGSELEEGDARQDDVKPAAPPLGPAGRRMQALADDHLRANPKKTPAGAYAAVYAHPANAALREQVKNEDLMRCMPN